MSQTPNPGGWQPHPPDSPSFPRPPSSGPVPYPLTPPTVTPPSVTPPGAIPTPSRELLTEVDGVNGQRMAGPSMVLALICLGVAIVFAILAVMTTPIGIGAIFGGAGLLSILGGLGGAVAAVMGGVSRSRLRRAGWPAGRPTTAIIIGIIAFLGPGIGFLVGFILLVAFDFGQG